MNPIVSRYLSVPGVYDWLMCRKPVRDVTLSALERSFVYSIGLGMTKPIQFRPASEDMDPPDGNEIEDLLIVTDVCGDFVLGTIYGLSFPHIFARTPLMQDAVVTCRRFAVDLSRRAELEFVEFVWFGDGKLITMDRTFFHTETGELPTRAEAILYDTVSRDSFPETVLMRASLLELPDCRLCSSVNRPCNCPLPPGLLNGDARRKIQGDGSHKIVTSSWGQYAAMFMSKARNGRVSLKYFQNFPGVGEVQLEHRFLPIVNVLVSGSNNYIEMARRRAIHHLGLRITPRFETRFAMPSMLSDFENLHKAYTSGLRELTSGDMFLSLPDSPGIGLSSKVLASPMTKTDIFDPVYIEELLESVSSDNTASDGYTKASNVATDNATDVRPTTSSSQQQPESMQDESLDNVYETFDLEEVQQQVQQQAQQHPSVLPLLGVRNSVQNVFTSPINSQTVMSSTRVGLVGRNGRSYSGNYDFGLSSVSARSRSVRKPVKRQPRKDITLDADGSHQQRVFCTQCPSSFKTKGDLRRHKLTIHDKIKPFVCEKCNATFGHRGHLNRHIKTVHLRERPYRCEICGFRFLQASHLEMHQKMVHEKLKPFTCHICKLSVTTRSALRNHLRHVHNVADVYRCPLPSCMEGFILKFDLERHLAKTHRIEPDKSGVT